MKKKFLYFILSAFVFLLDQMTKFVARRDLDAAGTVEFFSGHLRLHLVHNTGAFLSMGADWPPVLRWMILIVLVFFFLFFLTRMILKEQSTVKQKVCYAIILGGGAGNLLDRLWLGEVTDFLWLGFGPIQTGVFNIADMAILFGVIVLLLEVHPQNKKKIV